MTAASAALLLLSKTVFHLQILPLAVKTKMYQKYCLNIILIYFLSVTVSQIEAAAQKYVTCGSVIKLMNTDYRVRLHSHDVKYGTGSGQQSVTATEVQEDINSHWVIKAESKKICLRGDPIKCGSTIRLEHLETKKNLHSHHFSSPLSGYQEISCYGDNGEGDTGDNWVVVCSGDNWPRDDSVMLKHVDTDMYLSASGKTFGRPINGQMEVVGVRSSTGAVHWQTMEGVYLHAPDIAAKHMHTVHTEL